MSPNLPHRSFPPSATHSKPGVSGLSGGQLNEIHAGMEDWAVAMAFALTVTAVRNGAPLVLVRSPRRAVLPLRPYGEGLVALGIDPARLLIIETRDDLALLRAGLEAARCPGLSALVLETWGKLPAYDLTASRRLVLAAERAGIPVIVLRLEASPRASAAHSRWLIRSIPSTALAAKAPGPPAIMAELLRRRGGTAGLISHLEWNDEDGAFRERAAPAGDDTAPLSGDVVSLAGQRKGTRANRAA